MRPGKHIAPEYLDATKLPHPPDEEYSVGVDERDILPHKKNYSVDDAFGRAKYEKGPYKFNKLTTKEINRRWAHKMGGCHAAAATDPNVNTICRGTGGACLGLDDE
jgi:hypothetical protein